MIVFMILGHRATIAGPSSSGKSAAMLPRLVCLGVLLVLGIHLFNVFQHTFGEATLRAKVRQNVEQQMLRFPGSSIGEISIQDRFGLPAVMVAVKSPHQFSSAEVGRINDLINTVLGAPVDLHLRSEAIVETTRDGAAAKQHAAVGIN